MRVRVRVRARARVRVRNNLLIEPPAAEKMLDSVPPGWG